MAATPAKYRLRYSCSVAILLCCYLVKGTASLSQGLHSDEAHQMSSDRLKLKGSWSSTGHSADVRSRHLLQMPAAPARDVRVRVIDSDTLNRRNTQLLVIHGWVMGAAFCLVLPLGLVIAHGFKASGKWWVWAHAGLQVLAFLMSLAGILVIIWIPIHHTGHRSLGIIVQGLLGLQVLFGWKRPVLQSRYRRLFNVTHWWMGRLAAAIGIAEVFYGLWMSQPPMWCFLAALFTILAVGAVMVYRDIVVNLGLPPPGGLLPKSVVVSVPDLKNFVVNAGIDAPLPGTEVPIVPKTQHEEGRIEQLQPPSPRMHDIDQLD